MGQGSGRAGRWRSCCCSSGSGFDDGSFMMRSTVDVYSALSTLLADAESRLDGIEAEDAGETAVLRGLFVRTLVGLVNWKDVDLAEHGGSTSSFLRALCKRRLPWVPQLDAPSAGFEKATLKAYHTGLCARYPGRGGAVTLMKAALEDHRPQCDSLTQALPGVGSALATGLQYSLAFNMPGIAHEALESLNQPAILAFSFGTGRKIGPAEWLPALVGPSCGTPGNINCALAAVVAALLRCRKMPVFAQWEVADALLHGSDGCPAELAVGYRECDYTSYPLVEEHMGCHVYKSVPCWPEQRKRKKQTLEQMYEASVVRHFFLSARGVMSYFRSLWAKQPSLRPGSIIVVAFPDVAARCADIVRGAMAGWDPPGPAAGDSSVAGSTDGEVSVESTPQAASLKVVLAPDECFPAWQEYNCNAVTGYDPSSGQPWTTSRTACLIKEVSIRLSTAIRESCNMSGPSYELVDYLNAGHVNSVGADRV
eukprot:TRINITY_DN63308_c0_g1_i1.p1 TRINITY_DN63308_c0_g1~~TRINITY_DN63308_c0_g1_i1.p1  ORF type:complete len:481 (-),score=56.43 TRINITY_DN63308_c0_g1_i1:90-1532(-)